MIYHDEKCIEDYEKYKDTITKVKGKVMEWMEDVEEARNFVEEAMQNNEDFDTEETCENLDQEKHKDDLDCELEGIKEYEEQAGAKLGQAQLQLELGFT